MNINQSIVNAERYLVHVSQMCNRHITQIFQPLQLFFAYTHTHAHMACYVMESINIAARLATAVALSRLWISLSIKKSIIATISGERNRKSGKYKSKWTEIYCISSEIRQETWRLSTFLFLFHPQDIDEIFMIVS
jgi:hypothetical protein